MPFSNVVEGSARRCKAKAKSTGEQCWEPAAFGTTVCRCHGAVRPEARVKGEKHHWFKHGEETAEVRRERPALNRRIKAMGKALMTGDYNDLLPEDKALQKLQKELNKILKKRHLEPKPKQPITTLQQAKPIKPKPKTIPTPAAREKHLAYMRDYARRKRQEAAVLKQQHKADQEKKCQDYLKSTKEQK